MKKCPLKVLIFKKKQFAQSTVLPHVCFGDLEPKCPKALLFISKKCEKVEGEQYLCLFQTPFVFEKTNQDKKYLHFI